MALSESIGKAQTPAVCSFCEESQDIKWKCIDCELFLCNLCCSKIHNKSKASTRHEIINLDFDKEGLASSMRKVDLQNMVCTKHSKQRCFVYCNECGMPACSKCLMEPHKEFNFKDLGEVYNDIMSEMKELKDNFETFLQFFRNEKDKLQKLLSDGDTDFQEARNIIMQTEKEMKEDISKHANELLQELDARWKPSENNIKIEISVIKEKEEALETRTKNLHQALQSHQARDIFSTGKTLDKSEPNYSVKRIKPCRTKFISTNLKVKNGSLMLGDLYTVPDFELIDTYQSDMGNVTCIRLCSDNRAFILGSDFGGKLQKIKLENHNIKVKTNIQIVADNIALINNGEILISSGKSNLKYYTKDGRIQTFKSFSPLGIVSVHVTKCNDIIVGLADSFTLPVSKDSIRKLVIMNKEGDIQHTIEYDREGQKMLTYPRRINSFNDNLIVIDITNNKFEGRVVMLDYGGQLLWTYNGSKNNISNEFNPKDVAITTTKMILVSDFVGHSIHLLNPAGEVLVCKSVKHLGIELPYSIAIDKNDVLWIGCSSSFMEKTKNAKIHSVKLIY